MSAPIGSPRAEQKYESAYLSGTATAGEWLVWSPTQDFSQQIWTAEKGPSTWTDWDSGAFLFAGVVVRDSVWKNTHTLPQTGQTIPLVRRGYHPAAMLGPDFLVGDKGYPLILGGSGVIGFEGCANVAPLASTDVGLIVGASLDAITVAGGSTQTARVFVLS